MIIENSLLKQKVYDMQDRFRRIEDKREAFIKELQDQAKDHEVEQSKAKDRRKNATKLEKQLESMEGQNLTLKSQIEFLTSQNRQKDVD